MGTFSALADLLRVSGADPCRAGVPHFPLNSVIALQLYTTFDQLLRCIYCPRIEFVLRTLIFVRDSAPAAHHVRTLLLQIVPQRPRCAPSKAVFGPHRRCTTISRSRRRKPLLFTLSRYPSSRCLYNTRTLKQPTVHPSPPPTSTPPPAPQPKDLHRCRLRLHLLTNYFHNP